MYASAVSNAPPWACHSDLTFLVGALDMAYKLRGDYAPVKGMNVNLKRPARPTAPGALPYVQDQDQGQAPRQLQPEPRAAGLPRQGVRPRCDAEGPASSV